MQQGSVPRRLRAPGLAAVALIAAALLAFGSLEAHAAGSSLRIAAFTIQQLDPYKLTSDDEVNVYNLIFDALIVPSPHDGRPIPHLAESWETPDETTWIFHLRKGVYFQDGNPVFPEGQAREVTADDVVYSIERFQKVSTAFT
ncbi:MAG TPA: ABC transporter substrate-binding protein, partial [Limnochorda sp.]